MSISERQKQILEILNARTYISVNELAKLTFTSASSIRRDLSYLQDNGMVKRLHGGVSLSEPINNVASFYDRAHKNVKGKRIIAQKAARLLKDGQSVLLDSSTTATFLLPFIAKLCGITLFTNNLTTALSAIELGINTNCLGGHSVNGSSSLSGPETFKALSDITADIMFFSSQSLDASGNISDSTQEENFTRKVMLSSSKTKVFLCDSEKFGTSTTYKLCTLEDIDYAVFDEEYKDLNTNCKLL